MLIVDDDKDMCQVISSIMREEGFKVSSANDAHTALARIKRRNYDLMILDYKLNGTTGLEILEAARKLRPELITIMISAYGTESVRTRAKELGAYGFLDKPFNIDRLTRTVKRALKTGQKAG